MLEKDLIIWGKYKHFPDWGIYRVDNVKLDATGYEETWKIWKTVLYTQLTDGEKYLAWTEWTRKLEDFVNGVVKINWEVKDKFELIID